MKMNEDMELTDYIIKGETVAAALKSAGEVVSDGLLQSMLLNGLPKSVIYDHLYYCGVCW